MKTLKDYICSVRFPVILIICIIVLGSIGYYAFSTNDTVINVISEEYSHGYDQAHEHVQSHVPNATVTTKPAVSLSTKPTEPSMTVSSIDQWKNDDEINILRDYLRIPTAHPDIIYKDTVYFIEKLAAELNLTVAIYHPVDDKNPVVVLTWKGSQPELPSIVLNSHMDVVPVYEEFWSHPPFGAEMEENGDIFARGTQDTKSIGMMYLGAIRALKRNNVDRLERTIHVLYVPDEELGGKRGMAGFVKTDEFNALNIGFMLDEGHAGNIGPLDVFNGERTIWQIEFIFNGHSGHGSMLFDDTPGEKLSYVASKFMEFRREEQRKLNDLKYAYGNVTTINLTVLKGGIENNVIPAQMMATFDIRVSISADLDAFEYQIKQWCQEAGGNITMNFVIKGEKERITPTDDSNPYWLAFKDATDALGIEVKPTIRSGGSDGRFVRRESILALGFSPIPNTELRMHDHNEYINAGIYLKGIEAYTKIITNLARV